MTKEEIEDLTSSERLAGFMLANSKLAVVGARLRKSGRDDRTWSIEENKEWDDAADELDPWWYSLTEKEIKKIKEIQIFMADITCARL